MEKSNWVLGPLLWDVARYWNRYDLTKKKSELFSGLYGGQEDLALFASAVENDEINSASKLIREAIALATGYDEGAPSKNQKATDQSPALSSILSNVRIDKESENATVYHELNPLQNDSSIKISFSEKGFIDQAVMLTYLDHFMKELEFLKAHNSHTKIEIVLALLEKYFCNFPRCDALAGSDIPLFAASKMAAAIAGCWPELPKELPHVPEREAPFYALVYGDLSGIQKYIYLISSAKAAAKGLKGRSFELGLLTDAVVKYLSIEFELSSVNVIYNNGGSFLMLVPANKLDKMNALQERIDDACFEEYDGDIYLGFGTATLNGNDFFENRFALKKHQAVDSCSASKRRKFHTVLSKDYDKIFEPKGSGKIKPRCDVCGWEDESENKLKVIVDKETGEERKICPQCDKMETLGRILAKSRLIVEVYNGKKIAKHKKIVVISPLDLGLDYYLSEDAALPKLTGEQVSYYSFNTPHGLQSLNIKSELSRPEVSWSFRLYSGNELPLKNDNTPAEYDDLAERSTGLKRLGVLRMDVDNLGEIFRVGLKSSHTGAQSEAHVSPARLLTLSWMMNHFFASIVGDLRNSEKYRDHALIVYSGGDDLFVVGSWDRLVAFAADVRDLFEKYVNNSQLTISGGIAIIPKKYPIHKAAALSGEAEDAAKKLGTGAKNAFTLLEKPLQWQDFLIAESISKEVVAAISTDGDSSRPLNKGILERLRRIYGLYMENVKKKQEWPDQPQIPNYLESLLYDKWRWMLIYSLSRFKENNSAHKDLIKRLQTALVKYENGIKTKWKDKDGDKLESTRPLVEYLDVPARWAEFLTRQEN